VIFARAVVEVLVVSRALRRPVALAALLAP
jgi:hypothetical protein